jgi:hypothetical protein
MSAPDVVNTPAKWAKLWLHESERVYADRLVSQGVSSALQGPGLWPAKPQSGKAHGFCAEAGCTSNVINKSTAAGSMPSAPGSRQQAFALARSPSPLPALHHLHPQDLDNYNKAAVAVAKKYLALPGRHRTQPASGCDWPMPLSTVLSGCTCGLVPAAPCRLPMLVL